MSDVKFKPVVCLTVGDVLAALAEYPKDAPVRVGMDEGLQISLYNRGTEDEVVEFEETEEED